MPLPSPEQIETFLLVFVRCLTFWSIGPLLSDRKVPAPVKLLGGLATAIAVFSSVDPARWVKTDSLLVLVSLVVREVLMGAALGITASLVFLAVRMAGSLLGVQMGFSIANVIDPQTQTEMSILSEVQELLAIFLFLLVDGHHRLFQVMAVSLDRVPPGAMGDVGVLAGALVPLTGAVFGMMIQIGAPILGAMFLTDAALGFVARAVPQMNVFIVGIPVKIAAGMALLIVTAPLFARLLLLQFSRMDGQLLSVLRGM
jgi:flagellar biosynthesis protein FliR